jgi:hypothetical protein
MQTIVRGHTIQIDPQLISAVIGVPVLPVPGVPFPDGVEAPNMDYLLDFFGTRPQGEERSHFQINIGAFAPMHRFLAKIDQLLASSSSECAYSQEDHPSLCYCVEDTFLSVQAHFAYYARGS